jgi:putative cell wall-binding protein
MLLALLAGAPFEPAMAQGHPVVPGQPSQWPSSPGASPRIEGYAHAARFAGPDRYQTALALSLGLRGGGGFPFDTPDRSSGGAATLAAANGWWGVGACPRAVVVVAGDNPADALAASSLSDPTGRSSEPFLQRTAAADPLFDPIGGFARVDTDQAPILVTGSARSGATALTVATRIAAADLRAGGCTTARQAIVVGGPSAVPPGVEAELVSIGYDEVFRVFGADRYATAAQVARSLGTAAVPASATGCADPVVNDGSARMGFYANSVVELRDGPTSCRLLGRTVVLADGLTGADALAAGWWTGFWQVPVLLHGGGAALPDPTVQALQTMTVDNLVVLGGSARIGDAAVAQAVALTGASAVRLAGADRYATSVEMARRLGGWWPTGRGSEFEASLVCLAASFGEGPTARGWPDALAAGPWCGAANGAAAGPGAPVRALPPTNGPAPATTAGEPRRPSHDAVPVLLVPAGATTLPAPVADLLRRSFEPADVWCSSVAPVAGCLRPGFAVAFGGSAAVSDAVLDEVSRLMSGGRVVGSPGRNPRLDNAFGTALDLAPVFAVEGSGGHRFCVERDGYASLRWLSVFGDAAAARWHAASDVMSSGRYARDADGRVRSPGVGSPACVSFDPTPGRSFVARGASLTGRATAPRSLPVGLADRFTLTGEIHRAGPDASSGLDSALDPPDGGVTTLTFVTVDPGVAAVSAGESAVVGAAGLTVVLTRGLDAGPVTGPDRFSAVWSITTARGTVSGSARGEAILSDGTWRLRGRSDLAEVSWGIGAAAGGFRADLVTGGPGLGDDAVRWRVDALASQ